MSDPQQLVGAQALHNQIAALLSYKRMHWSTYLIAGEILAIPHLFVGLGMTALISVSTALIPLMQRGHVWARNMHISLNVTLLLLFSWQIVTGLSIVKELLS